jgi:hypothetical protein
VKCFSTAGIQQKMLSHLQCQYCFAENCKRNSLSEREHKDLENLPSTFMICYLNGFEEAKQKLIDANTDKPFKPRIYHLKKVTVLRKMKYDVQ